MDGRKVNGGTQVEFVHAGFTRTAELSDSPFGWSHFLGELSKVAVAEAARA